jgi:ribosomal protein L37AE/L43A
MKLKKIEVKEETHLTCPNCDEIVYSYKGLWNCLKFEKSSTKVIGYTFDKKDVDKFEVWLKKKFWEEK